MEEPRASGPPRSPPAEKLGRGPRLIALLRRHPLEAAFGAFTLGFILLLRFVDTGNLWGFFQTAAYLAVGRNPYLIYAFPAPPGLFLPVLPAFGVYVFSGYDFGLANVALKLIQLVALFLLAYAVGRIGVSSGLNPQLAGRLRVAVLLSPVLFYVSFVWVEQDVVGLALAGVGILFVLRGADRQRAPWEEAAGFGMLAFATFTYYFPAFLIPTLIVYSRTWRHAARRLAYAAISLGGFFAWFFVHPGWDFAASSVGSTLYPTVSVYSPLSFLSNVPFGTPTPLQVHAELVFVVVLVLAEILVPLLFRRWKVSWTVSLAFAIVLPFLLLNIWNGDELVWPLPFLLLALLVSRPSSLRGIRLWLVQLFALPMVVLSTLYDAPGPGAGSGVFYFGYDQFHNAVAVSLLIPQLLSVTRVVQIFLWSGLILLLGVSVAFDRARSRTGPSRNGSGDHDAVGPPRDASALGPAPNAPGTGWTELARRKSLGRQMRWVTGFVLIVAITTVLSTAVSAPVLTASPTNEFPVGIFAAYPVANGSVTYTLGPGSDSVQIVPNYGNWTSLGEPWQMVNFTRNIANEELSMDLNVSVTAPTEWPYNTSVIGYGSTALNAVVPFVSPAPSTLLAPVLSQNVPMAPALTSPQFVGSLTGARVYNGSSFARYDATPLERPDGQVTLFFRWSGIQLVQNDIVTLYRGNVSYQLFGVGGVYTAGMKPTLNDTWRFAYPRLVNNESWHELTLTNASNGTQVALDGMPIPLPPVPLSAEMQGAELLVGSVNLSSSQFQNHDFWGTVAGPYNTTDHPAALGSPLWCPASLFQGNPPPGVCTPYASSLTVRSSGMGSVSVTTPSTTYWLNSTLPTLGFGRLSDVGPALTIQIRSLSISTTRSLLPFAWFVDGVLGAPVLLLLLARAGRGRPQAHAD